MKKLLLGKTTMFLAILMLFAAQSFAQNQQHIIGDGTIETNYPPNTQVFEYGWSTMLYTSAEAGDAKTIIKIAFDQTTDYGTYWEYAILENQKIYMKQVNLPSFTSLAYEDPDNSANGYTLVFDGTIQFNLGWTEIELVAPFVYDGTSDLIVHYENHRGTSAPIINVKFNATAVTDNVFKALGGDGSFPTAFGTYIMERPNIALYYDDDNPATPVNPTPANNSFKAKVDTDLEFIIGNNTTTYDVYFGTNNPPTALLLSDASVSSPGSYTCNPASILGDLLDSYTQYYWMVVAKDGSNQSSSEVWNFTTQGVIENFPYFTSFEDQPIRTLYADTVDWSWPISGPANWHMIDFSVHNGDYAVACNVWADTVNEYSLVSPRIYLPANQRLSFWWMMNNGDFSNINVYFEITTDGGQSWELLMEFLPENAMTEYEQILIDVNAYAGNNVYLRWRYETLAGFVPDYFYLDDLAIEDAPTGPYIQIEADSLAFPNLAVGGQTYLPLEVTNTGVNDLIITGSGMTAPFEFTLPAPIPAGQSAIVNIYMVATQIGTFNQTFEFTGNFSGAEPVQLQGDVYEPTFSFFENADLTMELPENWMVIRTLDPYDIFTNVEVIATAYDAYSPPNAFRMLKMNDTISPLMLVTEGVDGHSTNVLKFYAKKTYDDYDAELQVGLTVDPLHAESFIAVETFVMTTDYQLFEVEFSSTTTEPYISFSFLGGRYASAIWIDDISWDQNGNFPPYCPNALFPSANAVDVDIMMGLTINWTSGGGNPTGYKLSLGTNPEANNILDAEDMGSAMTYTFPSAPDYGQQYFWKVVAYNNWGESDGCSINSFTTMQDPAETVPFFEDFDEIDAIGDRDYPLGWSIDNANNDNFPWDLISNVTAPDIVHSVPNAMHMLFSLNTMDDYLFTPPVILQAGVNYEVSFWFRTMGDAWVPDPVEKMKVLIGDDNTGAAMTVELWDNQEIMNQSWQQANASFSVSTSGEYFLGFYGYSDPNQGLLLLDDVGIDFATGIVENANTNTSFYPNPANNEIRIVSEDKVEQVEIYSMEGKIVYSQNYTSNMLSCDISSLNDGLYIVMIKTDKGSIREKLIVY